MKMGRQRRRMEARARDRGVVRNLNMISLLDIFTILLLFLLVQAGDPEEALPIIEGISLPSSSAEKTPKRTLTVTIVDNRILVEGHEVARLSAEADDSVYIIEGLADALEGYLEAARARYDEQGGRFIGKLTIMGDRDVPYSVLERVIFTCASRHFGHISLAVQRLEQDA